MIKKVKLYHFESSLTFLFLTFYTIFMVFIDGTFDYYDKISLKGKVIYHGPPILNTDMNNLNNSTIK